MIYHSNTSITFLESHIRQAGLLIFNGTLHPTLTSLEMLAAARHHGQRFIPSEGCDNPDDEGRCQGHEEG